MVWKKNVRRRITCDHKFEYIEVFFIPKTNILLQRFFLMKLLLAISNDNS